MRQMKRNENVRFGESVSDVNINKICRCDEVFLYYSSCSIMNNKAKWKVVVKAFTISEPRERELYQRFIYNRTEKNIIDKRFSPRFDQTEDWQGQIAVWIRSVI